MTYLTARAWKQLLCRMLGHQWACPWLREPTQGKGEWTALPPIICDRCGHVALSVDELAQEVAE